MFKVKDGINIGGKILTASGPTTPLTVSDVGSMAFQNAESLSVDEIGIAFTYPKIILKETDGTVASGAYRRIGVDSDIFSIRRNTAAGGDFSTEVTDLSIDGTGKVLVNSSMSIANTTIAAGGAVTVTLPTLAGTLIGTGDSGTISTNMLANDAVTYAKLQNVSAQYRILGRISASAGDTEALTPDNVVTVLGQATTKTGTGSVVLDSSPTLTTPTINTINASASNTAALLWNTVITTGSISMGATITTGSISLVNGTTFAGSVNIASGAGAMADTASTVSILSGAQTHASAGTRTLNLGTSGSTNVTTNVNIGSSNLGTATVSSPTFDVDSITITMNGSASGSIGIGNLITTGSLTLVNAASFAGTVSIASGAGAMTDTSSTVSILAGVQTHGSGATRTLNLGTSGSTLVTTNVNIGSSNLGTTTIDSPTTTINSSTTGTVNIGSLVTTGTVNIAPATTFAGDVNIASGSGAMADAASTVSILSGVQTRASAGTRTLNLGTSGSTNVTTNVNIGSSNLGTTTIDSPTTTITSSTTGTVNVGSLVTTGTVNIANATTFAGSVNIASGAGAMADSASTVSILSGAQTHASAGTRTLNLGTSGSTNVTTNVNIGSTTLSTTVINSPTVNIGSVLNTSGSTKTAGYFYTGTTAPSNTNRLNYDGNLYVNELTASGDITAFSDYRLKNNFSRIDGALDKVSAISGYTYNMIGNGLVRHTGLIAQEVRSVLPEAVIETESGMLALAYGNMVGLLVEAIKELKIEVDSLKGVINGS